MYIVHYEGRKYYYSNKDSFEQAVKSAEIKKCALADIVIDINTNELVKCRCSLEEVVDAYAF